MGGNKAPVERLRGVSHLENEGSRQAFWIGDTTRCSSQYSPGGHENRPCLWLIHSLEQRPKYEEMGGKKEPLERLRGVSHLENEWSRQAFSRGHTTRCSDQYSTGDTKTALVFG